MELYEDMIETIKKYRSFGASLLLKVSVEIWIKYGYTIGNSVS